MALDPNREVDDILSRVPASHEFCVAAAIVSQRGVSRYPGLMSGPRAYTPGTRAALIAFSHGVCYFPGCETPVVAFVGKDPLLNVEIAHIRDARVGNRFDDSMTDDERRAFSNLILLCRVHHVIVDKTRASDYPIERLQQWKTEREGARMKRRHQERLVQIAETRDLTLEIPLDPAHRQLDPGKTLTPYQILWPRFGIVPFFDHAQVMRPLEAWCNTPDDVAAMFVDGAGGMGKTRSAIELCRRLAESGWVTGFFRPGIRGAAAALKAQRADQLIVLDYANDRPHQIVEFVDELLASRSPSRRIRLLLLTRTSGGTGRTRGLTAHQSEAALLLENAATISLHPGPAGTSFNVAAREKLFSLSRNAVLTHRGAASVSAEVEVDLSSDTYAVPLFVVLAAILSVDDGGLPSESTREQILERILRRESDLFWSTSPESDPTLRAEVVCVTTLAPVRSEASGISRLEALGYPAAGSKTRSVLQWLRQLYPGDNWANGLEPDLLGEYLAREHLRPSLILEVLRGEVVDSSIALRVLSRVLSNWPEAALNGAVAAATKAIPPLIEAWAEQERAGDSVASDVLESASALIENLPLGTVLPTIELPGRLGPAGAELAVTAAKKWLLDAPKNSDALEVVRLQVQVAERLGRAGHHDEAMTAIGGPLQDAAIGDDTVAAIELECRAQLIYARALIAERRPAGPPLWKAIGRLESLAPSDRRPILGLEATIRAQYADTLRFEKKYPQALTMLYQVIDLRRTMVDEEGPAHIPALAASLRTRAVMLHHSGASTAAREDVDEGIALLRTFAAGPANVFEHDLARSLELSATIHQALGERVVAAAHLEESIAIRWRLSEAFGVRPKMELVRTLVRRAGGPRAERALYFDDAARIVSELNAEAELTRSLRAELAVLANRLAAHAAVPADRERLRAISLDIELELASEDNTSSEAIKLQLLKAARAARSGQPDDALAYWNLARRVAHRVGNSRALAREFTEVWSGFQATVPDATLTLLDQMMVESASQLLNEGGADIPIVQLKVMAFVAGWLEQARLRDQEESVRLILRSAQERFVLGEEISISDSLTLIDTAIHQGSVARARAGGMAGALPPSTSALPKRKRKRKRRPKSDPITGN
jgi:hypothetical protein